MFDTHVHDIPLIPACYRGCEATAADEDQLLHCLYSGWCSHVHRHPSGWGPFLSLLSEETPFTLSPFISIW